MLYVKNIWTGIKPFLNKKGEMWSLWTSYWVFVHSSSQKVWQVDLTAITCHEVLLFAEGHAVGALLLSGSGFMGAYQNPVQRAVVFSVAVVCALGNGALNALVGVAFHIDLPPSFEYTIVCPKKGNPCGKIIPI